MSKKTDIISPLSIDLGAKNTGVYFAHYPADYSLDSVNSSDFKKSGKVYQLEKDKYTLLMAKRTAARHQRRGYDRRQMVKRLFKLIWEKHFKLPWDKDTQQTISFLLNRRGFTFLQEEYDTEILSRFPEAAYKKLPEELQKDIKNNERDGEYDFSSTLEQWIQEDNAQEILKQKLKAINRKPQQIKNKLFVTKRTNKLKEYCNKRATGEKIEEEKQKDKTAELLSELPKWVLDEWTAKSVKNLPDSNKDNKYFKNNKVDIVTYLNEKTPDTAEGILKSLQIYKAEDRHSPERWNSKNSIWNFNSEKFNMDDAKEKGYFDHPDESENEQIIYLKTHLHHLAYAIYKTHTELESGGRHRSKYFTEVESVLKNEYKFQNIGTIHKTNHDYKSSHSRESGKPNITIHGYLKRFLKQLHTGKFKLKSYIKPEIKKEWQPFEIEPKALAHLICHLSNLELKPLRKYFNDKRHQKTDDWDEASLAKIFENWILNEWRVDPEKNKKKANGKRGGYQKLKDDWKKALPVKKSSTIQRWNTLKANWKEKHLGKLINFWLNTDPFLTIPPYQNNNNRRPPKCQSLVLNPQFLSKKYTQWQKWLNELKKIDCAKDYISKYENELKDLQSGGKQNFDYTASSSSLSRHSRTSGNPDNTKKTYSYFYDTSKEQGKSRYQRDTEYLKTRTLQFILDRVKDTDPLKLNEIYSHAKKYRQCQSTKQEKGKAKVKLEKSLKNSKLPDTLKTQRNYTSDDLFKEGTFLHLVCKYYQQRQKAKDGRLFIHPRYRYIKGRGYENTGHFDDKNLLLTYCNYKPRQKRYQMLNDLAALLQVPSKKYIESISDKYHSQTNINSQDKINQKLDNWLNNITGLKRQCEQAAKEQKNRRGQLKLDIQSIYGLIYYNQNNNLSDNKKNQGEKEIKTLLQERSQINDALKLYNLCERAKKQCQNFTQSLYDTFQQAKWKKELENNPARAIYLLAQINNLVFKERSGNSNTCVVCSADNAQRMQTEDESNTAKAQRLPAISTRIIDGAMMRIARIVGGAIANDKWKDILPELKVGKKVCVPVITESNRFEFEPSREDLVKTQRVIQKKKRVEKNKEDSKAFEDKVTRIKNQNKDDICPYPYGKGKISGTGEIDHIIPRRSQWGVLNDEANLIWTSVEGNQHKTNKEVSLSDLSDKYKKSLFPGKNSDNEIKKWIIDQIGDGSDEKFKFGPYRSFINLTPDQQKAFRHALFLVGEPIRNKVIDAISNRTRAFVNGTQRYFAEVLANNLYKKLLDYNAKHKNKAIDTKNLIFDYFGVEALSNSRGDGVYDLRKFYEEADHPIFKNHKKESGKLQKPYSHLIDAQLAFCIAADAHKKEGGFKLNTHNLKLYPFSKKTGEVHEDNFFNKIHISDNTCEKKKLNRKNLNSKDLNFSHYSIFNSNSGAWHFLKLIEITEAGQPPQYLKGFLHLSTLKNCLKEKNWIESFNTNYCNKNKNLKYAELLNKTEREYLPKLYQKGDEKYQFGYLRKNIDIDNKRFTVSLYYIDKTKASDFLIKNFHTKSKPSTWKEKDCKILDTLSKLWYHTKRKNITEEKDLSFKVKNLTINNLLEPSLFKAWTNLKNDRKNNNTSFQEFLIKRFLYKEKTGYKIKKYTGSQHHIKSRKKFSLPVSATGQGWFLVKRGTWNQTKGNNFTYQCLSEDNKFSKFSKHHTTNVDILVSQYRQKNIFLFPKSNENSSDLKSKLDNLNNIIDSNKWYQRIVPDHLKNILTTIENKAGQDSRRAHVKLVFKNTPHFNKDFFKVISEFTPREIKKSSFDEHIKNNCDIESEYKSLKKEIEIKKEEEEKLKENKIKNINELQKLKEELKILTEKEKFYDKIKGLFDKIHNHILCFQSGKTFIKAK